MIEYVGYAVAFFLILRFIIGLVNLLWRQWPGKMVSVDDVPVSVLIPARNEMGNIENVLGDLLVQTHRGFEVIVYDDMSEDGTAGVVESFAKRDGRIRLIKGQDLPAGWFGKNHACAMLARESKGVYYLFLDADVRVSCDFVEKIVGYSVAKGNNLTSVFPRQRMIRFGEWVTVPLMNFILLSLLPLVLVRRSSMASLSAANGQCMLFDSAVYDILRPHEAMRLNRVEDIAIARYYKRKRKRVTCLASVKEITCRMYPGYREALNGFSKNVTAFFGNSFILAVLFWLVTTFGWVLLWLVFPLPIFIILMITAFLTRIFISIASNQNLFINILLIIPQALNLGVLIGLSAYNRIKKRYTWKGRNIS